MANMHICNDIVYHVVDLLPIYPYTIHACMQVYICSRIWENVHSSHIQLCSFGDPLKLHGMVYRFETFREDKGLSIVVLYNP